MGDIFTILQPLFTTHLMIYLLHNSLYLYVEPRKKESIDFCTCFKLAVTRKKTDEYKYAVPQLEDKLINVHAENESLEKALRY